METLGENIRKLLLAGVGAVATTAEKSQEVLEELVKKGELTVEQGKVLNEELKHNIKKSIREKVAESPDEYLKSVDDFDDDQLAALKKKIEEVEAAKAAAAAEEPAEAAEEDAEA